MILTFISKYIILLLLGFTNFVQTLTYYGTAHQTSY